MTSRIIPLIGKALGERTPAEFRQFVRSLYERPEGTSPIDGIKISFGEKVTQVRFVKGKAKEIKAKDVKVLAEFYKRKEEELLELFAKRKVKIL